jgi:3-methyladenine DNA glycosylase/8-oxoguanine DNA glycosylase
LLLQPSSLRRAVAHLKRSDPVMAGIIERIGPCRLTIHRDPHFPHLVGTICYQQLAGAAAAAIHRRVLDLCGGTPRPRDILSKTDAELRGAGLSRQKIAYLRDLAAKVEDGLPLHRLSAMSDEAVMEALTSVKGIGQWTAEIYLMFRLGRPDVLPVDDYGLRKAMQRAWRKRALPKPEWMRRTSEPWRPWRTVASWYLWQSIDTKEPT